MKKLTLLGDLTPEEFLRDYWHKKPLLIRAAIPGFQAPIELKDLIGLAKQEDVESRLITFFKNQWKLQSGPFADLPATGKKAWTLLVQGANLHHQAADALLRQFNFLPDARLDDLMISYATDGGGVGPHFDSYDVFLLQAKGQRRWQISTQSDLTLVEGMPLKILRNFAPEQEFILEPGDMLYLPPHCAHDGVAIGECMTYSIGFRAPTYQELGEAFLQFMADSIDLPGRCSDTDLKVSKHPAEISKDMLDTVSRELKKVEFTQDDFAVFIGEYLSSPKPSVFFNLPEKPLPPSKFLSSAKQRGIQLTLKTRMLYRGKNIFINGESFGVTGNDKNLLVQLANLRELDGASVASASNDMLETLCIWYEDGWIAINS
ncbi:50S ribosomal protein L16 3-hydroxylase [Oxalobacteraceae bacterium GrIS 2.11]